MKYDISFQEMAKLAAEQIAKQKPVTLPEARAQYLWLKVQSSSKNKKKRKGSNESS